MKSVKKQKLIGSTPETSVPPELINTICFINDFNFFILPLYFPCFLIFFWEEKSCYFTLSCYCWKMAKHTCEIFDVNTARSLKYVWLFFRIMITIIVVVVLYLTLVKIQIHDKTNSDRHSLQLIVFTPMKKLKRFY